MTVTEPHSRATAARGHGIREEACRSGGDAGDPRDDHQSTKCLDLEVRHRGRDGDEERRCGEKGAGRGDDRGRKDEGCAAEGHDRHGRLDAPAGEYPPRPSLEQHGEGAEGDHDPPRSPLFLIGDRLRSDEDSRHDRDGGEQIQKSPYLVALGRFIRGEGRLLHVPAMVGAVSMSLRRNRGGYAAVVAGSKSLFERGFHPAEAPSRSRMHVASVGMTPFAFDRTIGPPNATRTVTPR